MLFTAEYDKATDKLQYSVIATIPNIQIHKPLNNRQLKRKLKGEQITSMDEVSQPSLPHLDIKICSVPLICNKKHIKN